jgi:serine protease AprX
VPPTALPGRDRRDRRDRRAVGITLTLASALLISAWAGAGSGSAAAQVTAQSHGSKAKPAKPGNPVKPSSVRWGQRKWGDKAADLDAQTASGKNDPSQDAGSLATVTTAIGARSVWGSKDSTGRAITGQGVTVALLDTGIATNVAGLNGTTVNGVQKVVSGPDLSLEANSPALTGGDNFGHGTHLAGIIAGRDPVSTDAKTGEPKPAGASVQLGVAPDAGLLSVKLGTRDGSTDVSQVIAGLDWVVQHRNDNGMRIRVINLSYGTESTQAYQIDPLAAAVENAWQHGIVVVVSGGNDGTAATGLTDPALDPYVIAVGASDPQGMVSGWNNPVVASFSSHGTTARHVDLLAPGTSIAALRDPGSYVDATYPEGLVDGDSTGRLFRGSGTSQAAAVVSGSVALLLQAYPDLTPDQVKAALVNSADKVSGSVLDTGAGELDVKAALSASKIISALPASTAISLTKQTFTASTGLGSLEAARGGSNLVDPDSGIALTGEVDVQNQPWNPAAWRATSVNGTSWSGGTWNGSRWTGSGWTTTASTSGNASATTAWASSDYSGTSWTGVPWNSLSWDGARWTGARWTGARWTGARWTSQGWHPATD